MRLHMIDCDGSWLLLATHKWRRLFISISDCIWVNMITYDQFCLNMINYDHFWWIMSTYDGLRRMNTNLVVFQWKLRNVYHSICFSIANCSSVLADFKGFERVWSNLFECVLELHTSRRNRSLDAFSPTPNPQDTPKIAQHTFFIMIL